MLESECSKSRATLHANIAACLIKLVNFENLGQTTQMSIWNRMTMKELYTPTTSKLSDAEQSQARTLTLGPRWLVHKAVDFLTSFIDRQLNQLADYKLLLELLPSGSLEVVRTKKASQTLEPRVQAARKERRPNDRQVVRYRKLNPWFVLFRAPAAIHR